MAITDAELADEIGRFYSDPYGFVMFAYDWGVGELTGYDGPDVWQAEALREWGRQIKANRFNGRDAVPPVQIAVSSGHGVGKSAFTAWIINFIMSTRPHSKGVVTASTMTQLNTKTWAELAKWTKRCITGHWFRISSGRGAMKIHHRSFTETWRCDAVAADEHNQDSFAGNHAADSSPYYIFDEASAVPDGIWQVAEGGLTDGEPFWFVFGNPTRNSGRFRECFGRARHRWTTRQVDSRQARIPNKEQIQKWLEDYGEDSDFFRVRVRGVFPRGGSMQFIAGDTVREAMEREPYATIRDPLIMGIDVARFGDDQTVIAIRRGLDARTIPWVKMRGADTMTVAAKAAELYQLHHIDAVFVDGGGVGGGVIDRLRMLRVPVQEVKFGGKAGRRTEDPIIYANKRAEIWGVMREWLSYGSIPLDKDLESDLTSVEYGYVAREGRDALLLEKKEDMKRHGLASPDSADALACTFAFPVVPSDHRLNGNHHTSNYDPLSRESIKGSFSHQSDYSSNLRN